MYVNIVTWSKDMRKYDTIIEWMKEIKEKEWERKEKEIDWSLLELNNEG